MMRLQAGTNHLILLASVLSLSVLSVGCASSENQSFDVMSGGLLPFTSDDVSASSTESDGSNRGEQGVVVQFSEARKLTKPKRLRWDPSLTVQGVVDKTHADKRFRNMTVYVERQSPEGKKVQMKSVFDLASRTIPLESDFHIHPNDRIVIEQAETTAVDAVVHSVFGNLADIIQ